MICSVPYLEDIGVEALDDVPLEVQGRERLHPPQVLCRHLLDVVLRKVKEGQTLKVPACYNF